MKLQLDFEIESSEVNLRHGETVVMLGSCFSDAMTSHFESAGFQVLSNPFGTLFHPLAIANVMDEVNSTKKNQILQRDDLYFSWLASGKLSAASVSDMEKCLSLARKRLNAALKQSKLLIVSFGSAWGYVEKDFGLVANCHKMPQERFDKCLSETEHMVERWKEVISVLDRINPKLQVIFTVSPVRHVKDGLVENNRSKARLLELAHKLSSEYGLYFPAYEIVIDQLRDHRFFKKDLVHPSDDAVSYVWERFAEFALHNDTLDIVKRVKQIKSTMHHKSHNPNSESDILRIEKAKVQQSQLNELFPGIFWG